MCYAVVTAKYNGKNNLTNIYFTESFDNGKTWSSFQILTNLTNEESCLKKTSSFLHIPSTGRLFVFYHSHCNNMNSTIRFMTRPPSSRIFSQSLILRTFEYDEEFWPSITAKYSIVKGNIRIHAFWAETSKQGEMKMMNAYSDNYGIKWSEPKEVYKNINAFGLVPLEASTNDNIPNVILGTFYNPKDLRLSIFRSTDNGITYDYENTANPVYSTPNHNKAISTCGTKQKPIGFWAGYEAFEKDGPDILTFYKYEIEINMFADKQQPYPELYTKDVVLMNCFNENGIDKVTLIVAGYDEKGEKVNVLFSQYIDN